jgi:hypothetical protein
MRNNKILAAAIASAVSLSGGVALLSAGDVFAGNLTLITPNAGVPPPFATELFPTGTNYVAGSAGVTGCANNHSFVIRYKVPFATGATLSSGNILKVKASLDNSAGWGTSIDPANQVRFCASTSLNAGAGACNAGDTYPATISKSSAVLDTKSSSVEFAVQVTADVGNATLLTAHLFFCPDVTADFLQNEGGFLSLTMESSLQTTLGGSLTTVAVGAAESIQIATSKRGLSVLIEEEKTPAVAAISFAADTLKFSTGATKNSMTDIDRVSLGKISIDSATAKGRDGSTTYVPSFSGWTGKLTIVDGPFSASTGTNQVFLDNDNSCAYDTTTTPPSVPATKVLNTTAEWTTLSDTQLTAIYNNDMYVCVIADGVKGIEEQPRAPVATLEMGSVQPLAKYSGRLRYIKENGTKCTLFNIPDGTEEMGGNISTDVVSVRITNNGPDAGTLYATLYDQSGKPIYTPAKRQAIGPIAPFQTVRYYTGQESADGYSADFDLTTYGSAQHWVGQRATVVIATELSDVSIFGLVRNRHGGPNMNISTGATGNGCD